MLSSKSQLKSSGVVIAAARGGSGKTILTLGLTRSLTLDNHNVVTFKKGPDYIDAGWMALASEKPCYNLDSFMMDSETILNSFCYRSYGADFSIVEGNRGLYDGFDSVGTCSTAELAKLLKLPVILVVDCTKATRSMAALVLGFRSFDKDVNLAGVVLNRVAGGRHESLLRDSIEKYTDVPVLGALGKLRKDPLPMRHLGLTPIDEHSESLNALDSLADFIKSSVDVDSIISMAKKAEVPEFFYSDPLAHIDKPESLNGDRVPIIGVIRDSAFQFYYPENLEAIERAGGKIVFLNAETGNFPSEINAIYIGGGFPETRAETLASNTSFKKKFREMVEQGLPVYAECGGLMYLGDSIVWKGAEYPMTGILSWKFVTGERPVGHGYAVVKTLSDTPFFKEGEEIKGHEFHYSKPSPVEKGDTAAIRERQGVCSCKVIRGHGFWDGMEGVVRKNVFGTYIHLHVLGNQDWALRLVEAAIKFKMGRCEIT